MPSEDYNKLTVLIEANTKSYERAMKKLQGDTNRALKKVDGRVKKTSKSFLSMEKAMGGIQRKALRLGGALAAAFTVREAVQFMEANTRVENSLKVAGLEGKKLEEVYADLFDSAQRNAAPLEALAELYGKAALVQEELGVTSKELVSFTDKVALALRVSGKSAAQSSGSLLQLSQALGAGTVRAEEFNSILEGAPTIALAVAAGLEEAGGSVAKLRNLVIDGKVSSEAFFRAFEAGSPILEEMAEKTVLTLGQKVTRLGNALTVAAGQFDDATDASIGLGKVLDELTGMTTFYGNHFDGMAKSISHVSSELWEAKTAGIKFYLGIKNASKDALKYVTELNDQEFLKLGGSAKLLNGDPKDALKMKMRIDGAFDVKTVSLKDFKSPNKPKKGKKSEAQKQREREIEIVRKEQEAITKLMDAKRSEIELIGASEIQIAKANAVRQLGLSATDEQVSKVEQLTETLFEQTDAWDAAKDAQDFFANSAYDSLEGVIDGSSSAKDSIEDLAKSIAKAALQATLLGEGPLAGVFGTKRSGGLFGQIFKGISGSGPTNLLQRAGGGSYPANTPMLVGERGPELIIPNTAGKVVNNHNLSNASEGVHVTVGISTDNNGNLTPFVEKIAKGAVGEYSAGTYERHLVNVETADKLEHGN